MAPGGPRAGMMDRMARRDHLIDAARVLAVATVVVYHVLFFEVGLDGGRLTVNRWEPGRPLLVLGWFVMILPVFFIAAGFGHAASADGRAATLDGAVPRLVRRVERLAGPIVLFVTALAALATVAAWWPGAPPSLPYPGVEGLGWLDLAAAVSRDYADFLWFLVAYLAVVALADVMVRLQERWGVAVVLGLGAGAALADQLGGVARDANWALVWLACHQFGVGLRRGWFTRWPWVTATTAAAGVVVLVTVAGYPLSPIANYYPPSVAIVLLGLAQASVLALLRRAGVLRAVGAAWERRLAVAGAHLVTVYLWQAACIIVAVLALAAAGRAVSGLAAVLLHPVAVFAVTVAVIVTVVPWIARVERWLGRGTAPSGRWRVAGVVVLLTGTALVWRNGAVLHPESIWSSAGVLLVWGSALLLLRTRHRPAEQTSMDR